MTEKYFKSLNYTLANEDTWPEVRMVEILKPKRILSVAGSGGRALPLLNSSVEDLVCVDLSAEQLALVNLRQETIKSFTLADFHLFWGYPPYQDPKHRPRRKDLFKSLTLPADQRQYFSTLFEPQNWDSILYTGKWESTFRKFSQLPRFMMMRPLLNKLASLNSMEDQKEFVSKGFPALRWKLVIKILGNAAVFNALLYKGHFIEKNVPETHFEYYQNAFNRIFGQTLIKKNFFAQLCFFGEIIHPEGIPVEGDEKVFNAMKAWLKAKGSSNLLNGNILELIPTHEDIKDIDFLSFSDVPSYFTGEVEKNYLQIVKPKMASGGVIVVRNYLREAKELDLAGYKDVTAEYSKHFYDEKVQMYMIKVFQKV